MIQNKEKNYLRTLESTHGIKINDIASKIRELDEHIKKINKYFTNKPNEEARL